MKYLFKFLESELWAGSDYAYNRRLALHPSEILPPKVKWFWKCCDCNNEFFTYNKLETNCPICDSEYIEKTNLVGEKD
jgi:hypothetical protein